MHTTQSYSVQTHTVQAPHTPTPAITTALSSLKAALQGPIHSEWPPDSRGDCALSHQAMREELMCARALVGGLAEIRVNKQHIVMPPNSDPPGSGKAHGAERESILVCSTRGTIQVRRRLVNVCSEP